MNKISRANAMQEAPKCDMTTTASIQWRRTK